MDDHDRQRTAKRDRTRISIQISITPASLLLLIFLAALLPVLFFAFLLSQNTHGLLGNAPTTQPELVAESSSQALFEPKVAYAQAYPEPAAAQQLPAASPAPAQGAQEVLAAGLADEPSAPVGLELPPVFRPTVVPAVVLPPPPPADLSLDTSDQASSSTAVPAAAPLAIAPAAPPAALPASAPAAEGAAAAPPADSAPTAPAIVVPTAVPRPVAIIAGTTRWTIDQSPIIVTIDQQVSPGATLILDPGVEVRLSAGVSIIVNSGGALAALGTAEQPVRLVGLDGQRWGELRGAVGSVISLRFAEVRDGGAGGTLISSEGGRLILADSRLVGNFGQVRANDSVVDIRGVEIANNAMPYGAALQLAYSADNSLVLLNNRITANRLSQGAPALQIAGSGAVNGIALDVRGNLLEGALGPGLELIANTPLRGEIVCNAFVNGSAGVSLLSDAPLSFDPGLNIAVNAIEGQTPPIIPFYLENGIGRGATSALPIAMINNWWSSPSGPYEPDQNHNGRGEAVGANIAFGPWLDSRPPCAPL